MKTAQWSLILSSDSRVNTQTHTVCAHTRLREYNFIYFSAEDEGAAPCEIWELLLLLCRRVWIYERRSKLNRQSLCIFVRSPSSGGICDCLGNKPAYICILFLFSPSLISDERKKAAQRGNDGGKCLRVSHSVF